MEVIIETEKTIQHRLSKVNPTNSYYVYVHRRLSDGKPFYVGKGKDYRAWSKDGRNDYWNKVVNKHDYVVDIVFDNLDEPTAFQCEIDTILELNYFGYDLSNLTKGGEGLTGYKWTEKQRKEKPVRKNFKMSIESVEKRAQQMRGRKYSEEHRLNISLGQVPRSVFIAMVNSLLCKRNLTYKKLSELSGVSPEELSGNINYLRFSTEQVMKSVNSRKGKPSWNAGKRSPESAGKLNNAADSQTYSFIRLKDREVFTGTRYDLCDKYDLKLATIGKLFYSKPNKTSLGWSLIKE